LPTLQQSFRSSFQAPRDQQMPKLSASPGMCPAGKMQEEFSDAWGHYGDIARLRTFVSDKCQVEGTHVEDAMLSFWDSFVQLPRPRNDIVYYAQGARFAVSRDRIRERSKDFYQRLLSYVSMDADPCLNYLYELVWYYILGKPETGPCTMSQDDKLQWLLSRMRKVPRGVLRDSGKSAISRSLRESTTQAPTPAPTQAPTLALVDDSDPKPSTEAHYAEGTLAMKVEDAEVACNDVVLLRAFQETSSGLVRGHVEATCREVVARRLRSEGRRLAGDIELAYRIAVPSEEVAAKLGRDVTAMPVETLTELINGALPSDHTYNITVTGKSEPTIVVTMTTANPIAEMGKQISNGHRHAPLGLGVMAVLAATCAYTQ